MVGVVFENTKLVTIGSAAALSGLLIGALWYRKHLKSQPPTKWVKVGEIEELCIYPVKSFKGIKTSSFECTPLGARLGFMRDRAFMVVNKEGKVVSGREFSKMTQFVPKISGTKITFSSPDTPEEIEIDIEKIEGAHQKVIIWGTPVDGIDCGDDIAKWLSKCILGEESGLRLLFCGLREDGKPVNKEVTAFSKWAGVQIQKSDGGMFSDGVSYHMISQASIKELNSRLDGAEVTAMNFRPNLIIKGEALIPYEEDNWKWVKIGNVIFQFISPCTRCLFTTIDPNTGKKSEEIEPLATLRRYRHIRVPEIRKILSSPKMGVYLGVRTLGNVSVGDEVFIPQM